VYQWHYAEREASRLFARSDCLLERALASAACRPFEAQAPPTDISNPAAHVIAGAGGSAGQRPWLSRVLVGHGRPAAAYSTRPALEPGVRAQLILSQG